MTATDARTREYDRFGPWIDEVRGDDDVPRLYRDHPIDFASAQLVLKVPRNIARRDATPEMDLYDHLLVVEPARLVVLSRGEDGPGARRAGGAAGYRVRSVAFHQVAAVRHTVDLLDGRLTVRTTDGAALTVRYNGSARAAVDRLVDHLRVATAVAGPTTTGWALLAAARAHPPAPLALGRDDTALAGDFREASRPRPDLGLWAWHGRQRVAPSRPGVLGARRLSHALSPMTLHGAVVAGDADTMEVFGRHDWLVRGTKPVHSASRLVVPLSAPERLRLAPHSAYDGAASVEITAGAASTVVTVPVGSSAYRLFAAAAAGGRLSAAR